ncbi:fungal-specific transcription factor domain-containing protein [Cyathus striatus]|nr:fungal-specific transcription factor domain-containing protein [Cyathus striatus]
MSSSEGDYEGDEPQPPHNKCTVCLEYNADCTFEDVRKKRGRPKGYVEKLEKRVRLLEGLLKKLFPDPAVLDGLLSSIESDNLGDLKLPTADNWSPDPLSSLPSPAVSIGDAAANNVVVDVLRKVVALTLGSKDDPFRDDDNVIDHVVLSKRLKQLSLQSSEKRFWGKSSGVMFVHTAILLKNEFAKDVPIKRKLLQGRRPMFWKRPCWEKDPPKPSANFTFPPPDLIGKLVDAYFEHVNFFYPLLHRPTFERSLKNSLHLEDEGFGSVLLLVCAVGSRYTAELDKRTFPDGVDSPYSAGRKWYNQVQVVKNRIMTSPTLYDLQLYCLAIEYLHGCSAQQTLWILVGFGIRLAQDVGAHRRRVPLEKLTVEDELWKRAFWVLLSIDRMTSMGMGRPCAISDDHFDLDMPTECDDEYWEHPDPTQRFKQPEGVPSTITAFNQQLRIDKIMGFALNTIYSIKTKFWDFMLSQWEQHLIAELDSALNNWVSSLPDFLRWDPKRADTRFFKLSGSLITRYYLIQILIHRPYIRTEGQPTPLAISSLAICCSAARSCSLALQEQMKRTTFAYQFMQMTAVPAGIILLLNMWGNKRCGASVDPKVISLIEQCMNVLKKAEERWRSAGMLFDILNELVNVGELLMPEVDSTGQLADLNQKKTSVGEQEIDSSVPLELTSHIRPHLPNDREQFIPMHNTLSKNLGNSSSSFNPDIQDLRYNQLPTVSQAFPESTAQPLPYRPMQANAQYLPPVNTAHMSSFVNNSLDSSFAPNSSQRQDFMDGNILDMWFNAPTSFQLNEWNTFLEDFAQVTNEMYNTQQTYTDYDSQSF